MNKRIYSLMLALLALSGAWCSCEDTGEIVFDHERQQFETRPDQILLEFIAPFGTTADEQICIAGAFNGDSAAMGREEFLLTKAPASDVKFGICLNPNSFVDGKTLADGYRFYSATQGMEYTTAGQQATHFDNPGAGTFANVWGQRWESYYWSGGDTPGTDPEPEPQPAGDMVVIAIKNTIGYNEPHLYVWGDSEACGGQPELYVHGQLINSDRYVQEYPHNPFARCSAASGSLQPEQGGTTHGR